MSGRREPLVAAGKNRARKRQGALGVGKQERPVRGAASGTKAKGWLAMTFYKFAVGVALTLAMIVVLGMSALVFSARDFQFGLAQIAPQTGGLVSFAELRANSELIDQIETAT